MYVPICHQRYCPDQRRSSLQRSTPNNPETQKTSSPLSPRPQKISAAMATPKTKIAQSQTAQPISGYDYFEKYMQIKGDKVVVDITVKEDMTSAKAELQKLGATIIAVYGRMISAVVPIASLSQLEGATSIRSVRPAYKPLHKHFRAQTDPCHQPG